MTQVTGTFKVMGWEEKPYDAAALPQLTHASVSAELQGGIEGEASIRISSRRTESNGELRRARARRRPDRRREGTFVMQDVGTFENGIAKGHWTILSGHEHRRSRGHSRRRTTSIRHTITRRTRWTCRSELRSDSRSASRVRRAPRAHLLLLLRRRRIRRGAGEARARARLHAFRDY